MFVSVLHGEGIGTHYGGNDVCWLSAILGFCAYCTCASVYLYKLYTFYIKIETV